ncbi:beta-mannosidase [Clostridium sp. USBA 49]|uniref:glycoside hydrolase family 2 protein n=1 Tax=Clostridium sp. USBA 49 TaxID=1881060 RepID=UPI0009CDAC04|nr:sugar-binding domain-containing protein [Clostridium sp. USBA 49]SKA85340.1 beta-mannosidase [Clostridium sp. USBA 49]
MKNIFLNGNDWLMKEFIGMDWVWRDSVKPNTKDVRWWNKATVPGSVLNDLFEDGLVPDPYFELNSKLVEWVPARTWVYKKKFILGEELRGKKVTLCFDGIDYKSEIFLNGKSIGYQVGMFIPWKKDITDLLILGEENLLAVVIEPAPIEQPQVGKTSLVYTHKSRMTYWWDFCPRMIHQGIWDDVYLKVTEESTLENVYISSDLAKDHSKANIKIEIETYLAEGNKVEVLFGEKMAEAKVEKGKANISLIVDNPVLWWPNGYGDHYMYAIKVILYNKEGKESDTLEKRFGIREIVFTHNDKANKDAPDFVLNVNGRKIYMNGYNWVPIDVMYGVNRKEKQQRLIRLAKEAGINIFRVWGGGLIEKDSFYDECAENGILIWQEFILSSSGIDNKTSHDENYIKLMKYQSEIIIKRKRNHTALTIWCGGNELQDDEGMPLNSTDKLLTVLNEQVEKFDSKRKWLPTSPSGGVFSNSIENIEKYPDKLYDVHGPWEHQGLQKHYKLYNLGTSLIHTEFGVEGMTNYNTLHKSVDPQHFLPASKDNEIYFHRGAWWTNEPLIQETFGGNLKDIESIRKASQYMQYEGLKYAVECNKRRAFHNSGTFPWQFNEPYPNNYCTSSLDYYGNPKPAYFGIKKAYSSFLISASFESSSLFKKEDFKCSIFIGTQLLSQELEVLEKLKSVVEIAAVDGTICYKSTMDCKAVENATVKLVDLNIKLNKIPTSLFLLRLRLETDNKILASNEYLFTKGKDLKDVFELEQPSLLLKQTEKGVSITNNGKTAVLYLFITSNEDLNSKNYLYFDNNYCCILPNEIKEIAIESTNDKVTLGNLAIEALNVSYNVLKE